MNIKEYVDKKKQLQKLLLTYFDDQNNVEENYQNLIKYLNDQHIENSSWELNILFRMLSSIASHHYRCPSFFGKIEAILQKYIFIFKNLVNQNYLVSQLFKIFLKNKPIMLFLIENKVIDVNEQFFAEFDSQIMNLKHFDKEEYLMYLFPEVKNFLPENLRTKIQYKIKDNDEIFLQKRKAGQNDSYISYLIRNDSLDEFKIFIEKNKLNLSSKIEGSFYETNTYLMKRIRPTMIEYAAFFGSIEIFKYLLQNKAGYSKSFWIYAMHCPNEELIHLMEKNNIFPDDNQYQDGFYRANHACEFQNYDKYGFKKCLVRTFKCHNINLSNYIISKYLQIQNNDNSVDIFRKSLKYYNFIFFPENMTHVLVINWLCKYNYIKIVELILSTTNVRIESTTILKI